MNYSLAQADARCLPLADETVHCVVISSPYWGLRNYKVEGQLGLEKTPEEFAGNLVEVFREVRRVLRADGTVWLNLGDSYASHGAGGMGKHLDYMGDAIVSRQRKIAPPGLKAKDQCLIPHRVALALQADGWWIRDTICWFKGNPMPGSMKDRTTCAHEYLFLITKRPIYYFDAFAIQEEATSTSGGACIGKVDKKGPGSRRMTAEENASIRNGKRNARSVWKINSHRYKGAHFATFPVKLAERCILAGTSEKGCCPACGAPWKRVVERVKVGERVKANTILPALTGNHGTSGSDGNGHRYGSTYSVQTTTTHWLPACRCPVVTPIPCLVMDCFNGAASTGIAALQNGRRYIGTDLSADYLVQSEKRIREWMSRPKDGKPRKPRPIRSHELLLFGATP